MDTATELSQEFCEEYRIIRSRQAGEGFVVLRHFPENLHPFITHIMYLTPGGSPTFFWGHYWEDEDIAMMDFISPPMSCLREYELHT